MESASRAPQPVKRPTMPANFGGLDALGPVEIVDILLVCLRIDAAE